MQLKPLAFEARIKKDCDYLLHLPNGETAYVAYTEDQGPTLFVGLWPGEEKTFIDARNKHKFDEAHELR
jgi:hypothetical protein